MVFLIYFWPCFLSSIVPTAHFLLGTSACFCMTVQSQRGPALIWPIPKPPPPLPRAFRRNQHCWSPFHWSVPVQSVSCNGGFLFNCFFTVSRLIEVINYYINTLWPFDWCHFELLCLLSLMGRGLLIGPLSSALIFRTCHPLQGQSIIDRFFHIVKWNKSNCNFLSCKVSFLFVTIWLYISLLWLSHSAAF